MTVLMIVMFLFAILWPVGVGAWILSTRGRGELKLAGNMASDGLVFFRYISPTMLKIKRHCKKDPTAQGEWVSLFGVIYSFKKKPCDTSSR